MNDPVAFVGTSNSGKTTLLIALVTRLAQAGERVAVIKHTHHDPARRKPRGDTELFLDAGASQVVLAGRDEAVILSPDSEPLLRRFESAGEIPLWLEADRVLVEGFKSLDLWPRILVERSGEELVRPIPDVVAVVSDMDENFGCPRFRHDEVAELCAFLDRLSLE